MAVLFASFNCLRSELGRILVHVLLSTTPPPPHKKKMSKQPSLWYVSEKQAIFRVKSSEKYAHGSVNVRRVLGGNMPTMCCFATVSIEPSL